MIWAGLIGVCAAGAAAFFAESAREQKGFCITRYPVVSDKLNGLQKERTIIFLSDLHNKEYGEKNIRLVKAIQEQKPDLILIGGDMLVGKKGITCRPAANFIKQLPRIAPVYCANGNHEQRMKTYPKDYGNIYRRYKEELTRAGVHFLENDSKSLQWDLCGLRVSGLEIPSECYEQFSRDPLTVSEVEERVGMADPKTFQILLAHNPVYFDTYRKWGADLVLSGHLHGGIVRIPGIGGVITPQFRFFPKYSGEMKEKENARIAVSKGLGTHTVNIRFCNPAEIVVLKLRGTGGKNRKRIE